LRRLGQAHNFLPALRLIKLLGPINWPDWRRAGLSINRNCTDTDEEKKYQNRSGS